MKVKWDENVCSHSGICVNNLPEVFRVENDKFVIEQDKAPEEDVRRVVGLCPSGALTIED